jgi:hypothetical protein
MSTTKLTGTENVTKYAPAVWLLEKRKENQVKIYRIYKKPF